MKGNLYGYARVSTRGQNEERQILALKKTGISETNIFIDKQSGTDFNRPEYTRLLGRLAKGDKLIVTSIDRLGRDYQEILNQWRMITQERGAYIAVIDMPLLDTERGGDLLGSFIADIVLQVLSFVAENERNNIRMRQAEGIAAAKARGVRFGRPPLPVPDDFLAIVKEWRSGKLSVREAARACAMPKGTFYYKAVRATREWRV